MKSQCVRIHLPEGDLGPTTESTSSRLDDLPPADENHDTHGEPNELASLLLRKVGEHIPEVLLKSQTKRHVGSCSDFRWCRLTRYSALGSIDYSHKGHRLVSRMCYNYYFSQKLDYAPARVACGVVGVRHQFLCRYRPGNLVRMSDGPALYHVDGRRVFLNFPLTRK